MADALVIGLAKKVKRGGKSASDPDTGADDSDDEGMSLDEAEADAVDDLGAAFGVEDFDREKATAALRDFVTACMKRQSNGEY